MFFGLDINMRVHNFGNGHINLFIFGDLILWRIKLKVFIKIILKVIATITDMLYSGYLLSAEREVFIIGDLLFSGPPHLINE